MSRIAIDGQSRLTYLPVYHDLLGKPRTTVPDRFVYKVLPVLAMAALALNAGQPVPRVEVGIPLEVAAKPIITDAVASRDGQSAPTVLAVGTPVDTYTYSLKPVSFTTPAFRSYRSRAKAPSPDITKSKDKPYRGGPETGNSQPPLEAITMLLELVGQDRKLPPR